MTANARAERRIQRRQALLTASDGEFALRATKFRKTMPPMVSEPKAQRAAAEQDGEEAEDL